MPVLQFRQFHVPIMHTMAAAIASLIDEAQAVFMQCGVSISVASCGTQPFPNPVTAAQYQLSLAFLRTEASGPLFENMKARLAGIASHTGFLGEDYLIKGVAGAIFWTILGDYVQTGRIAFSNRELRLDGWIRLPDVSNNLEARLLLLSRRLLERQAAVQLRKTGRGRFQLCVSRAVQLVEQA